MSLPKGAEDPDAADVRLTLDGMGWEPDGPVPVLPSWAGDILSLRGSMTSDRGEVSDLYLTVICP